jgi:acetyl esterase/lipase
MKKLLFGLATVALLISACSGGQIANLPEPIPTGRATDTPEPAPTPTSVPPTEAPTPEPSPEPTAAPFEVMEDVPYVADGDFKQKLDIYLPQSGDRPFPTLFAIHGGYGDKGDLARLSGYLAERGYAVVSINYRGMPYDTYPAEIQDAFCALAWTHANADMHGFDAGRIVTVGHSAGGTSAAMLGVVDDPAPYLEGCPHALPEANWVRGVATFTGIFDYVQAAKFSSRLREYIVEYLGGGPDEIPETWAKASPATWVDGSEPPFLLVHGAADTSIDPDESTRFATTLEDAGVNVELRIIGGASHGDIMRSRYFEVVETFAATLLEQE